MTPEKRESAIAWLNDEIRSLRLAPTINGCDMKPEWAEQYDIMQTCLEAVKVCSVDTNKTSPLTLEQLREMDGQPVWVECIKKWGIVDAKEDVIAFPGFGVLHFLAAGKSVYAYPPAHIDQEALESSEKDQVRISSSKGPDGLQIYIGFKCGKMEKDISFMFGKADTPLDDICKFLSQQLTELVQGLEHARESAEGGASV